MTSYFKKEVQEIMEPWFEAVKDSPLRHSSNEASEANLKDRSSALVFLNLVKRRKIRNPFSLGHNFVFPWLGY